MQRFAEMEKRAVGANNDLVDRAQSEVISSADFAEALERDVLPPWIETRERIEGLLQTPYGDRAYLSQLVEYIRYREESWRLQIEGLRLQDSATLERANNKWTAAEEMAKKLTAP
jgi:hypothetical protein